MSAHGNTPPLHRAAVVTPGRVFYGNGTCIETREGAGELLVPVLNGTVDRFGPDCCVILDGFRLAQMQGQSGFARSAGWNHSTVAAWTLFHRDDGRTVSVGVRDAFTGNQVDALFARDADSDVVAMMLDRYHTLTGCAWRGTYFTTAMASIRLTWENSPRQPLWHIPDTGPKYGNGPLEWTATPAPVEGWVHTFDANMAYLGAAINLDGAWSTLAHTGPQLFDDKIPGYWLVRLEQATRDLDKQPGRPPLFDPRKVTKGCVWVTTPYARLLQDLGDRVDVVDAWTATPTTGKSGSVIHGPAARVLRGWGERMRDARHTLDRWPDGPVRDALVDAVKRTYKDATGGLQKATSRVHRPDWAHHLIDLWRATLYRRVLKVHAEVGVWPVRVKVDSLSYLERPSDPPDRLLALEQAVGVRAGLGGFKHEATATVEAFLAARKPRRTP